MPIAFTICRSSGMSPVNLLSPGHSSARSTRPNVIPTTPANQQDGIRPATLGVRAVGPVGRFMDNFIGMPNWIYEWAVVVGDYYHTLGGDHASKNVYENGRKEEKKYERHLIGTTLFNDWAIKEAGKCQASSMCPRIGHDTWYSQPNR